MPTENEEFRNRFRSIIDGRKTRGGKQLNDRMPGESDTADAGVGIPSGSEKTANGRMPVKQTGIVFCSVSSWHAHPVAAEMRLRVDGVVYRRESGFPSCCFFRQTKTEGDPSVNGHGFGYDGE